MIASAGKSTVTKAPLSKPTKASNFAKRAISPVPSIRNSSPIPRQPSRLANALTLPTDRTRDSSSSSSDSDTPLDPPSKPTTSAGAHGLANKAKASGGIVKSEEIVSKEKSKTIVKAKKGNARDSPAPKAVPKRSKNSYKSEEVIVDSDLSDFETVTLPPAKKTKRATSDSKPAQSFAHILPPASLPSSNLTRKVSHDASSTESEPLIEKAPRAVAKTSGGARISRPLKKSPPESAPSRAALAVVNSEQGTSSPSRLGTPTLTVPSNTPSRLGTPTLTVPTNGHQKKRSPSIEDTVNVIKAKRSKREMANYTSSDEDESSSSQVRSTSKVNVGLGLLTDRGRTSERKSLTGNRLLDLAKEEGRTSSRAPTPGASPSSKLKVKNEAHYRQLLEKFKNDLTEYETLRQRLAERREKIETIVAEGQELEREGSDLSTLSRTELEKQVRSARGKREELAALKDALQLWTLEHSANGTGNA